MAFERSDDYMYKLTLEALDKHVVLDAKITFHSLGSKVKAYCHDTDTYLQFPRNLRRIGRTLYADVVKSANKSGTVFYRAFPGSIRETKKGDPIA